ncbi:MAG: AMP-binding protein [Halieaceae bacterium]|nr:AMP-binding protein [Halieaceae bacterium]
MRSADDIEGELVGPGGAFEIAREDVLGESIRVFKNRDRSLRQIVENSVHHGDNEYIVCEQQRISFREHLARVSAIAHHLRRDYGVQPGDRVAILADNHPQWIMLFWATVSIGGICTGLNGWWNREAILIALEEAEPKLLVGDRKRLARIASDTLTCPIICIEENFSQLEQGWDAGETSPALPDCDIAEDDPALILYTSGTTGRAKGVLLSHRNLVTFLASAVFSGFRMMIMEAEAGHTESDHSQPNCGLFSAPLFHLSGLFTGVITSLAVGMKSVWTLGQFEAEKVLQLIEAEKVTTWPSLGSMAARVMNHPNFDRYNLSSVSRLGSGGAPTSQATQERMTRAFRSTGGRMALGYGLTESSGVGTHNWGDLLQAHPNSVGRVFPSTEISIRDEENRELPAGQEGEICIRGSCVMLGYWRNPEATDAAIAPGRWLRTGDMGHFDDEFLYINTRARDLILRDAENIYPVEVEHCIELHPDILEAAVIGIPHPDRGQDVKAIVVVADGRKPSSEQLMDFCRGKLAAFKVPSQWDFYQQPLPRNAAGKIMKNVLAGEAEPGLKEE